MSRAKGRRSRARALEQATEPAVRAPCPGEPLDEIWLAAHELLQLVRIVDRIAGNLPTDTYISDGWHADELATFALLAHQRGAALMETLKRSGA